MATNVGSLTVKLGMPSDQLVSDAQHAETAIAKTQKTVATNAEALQQRIGDNSRQIRSLASTPVAIPRFSLGNFPQEVASARTQVDALNASLASTARRPFGAGIAGAAQQLGFGLQDFTSQLNNAKTVSEGLGRGIGAVANNVAMLGAYLNPTAAAVTAIGAAVASIVLPKFIEWVTASKDVANEMQRAEDRAKSLADAIAKTAGRPIAHEQIDDPRDRAIQRLKDVDDAVDAQRLAVARIKALDDAAINAKTAEEKKAILERVEAESKALQAAKLEMSLLTRNGMDYETIVRDAAEAKRSKKRDEQIAADKKAQQELFDDTERHQAELDAFFRDKRRKEFDAETKKVELKADAIADEIEKLRLQPTQPAASPAMAVSGTAAAASAINRALAGSRSEESDRRRQIRVLEDSLKVQRDIARQRGVQRAELF